MEHWDIPWQLALLAAALPIAALETFALATRRPDRTLTSRLRRWLGISPRRPVRRVVVPLFVAGLAGGAAWLVTHLLI